MTNRYPRNEARNSVRQLAGPRKSDEYYMAEATTLDIASILGRTSRLFVEVGPGIDPNIRDHRFRGRDAYIGFDGGSHDRPNPRLWLVTPAMAAEVICRNRDRVAERRPGENIYFMSGDGRALPLPRGAVHRLDMSNVLGNGMNNKVVGELLTEARRVIGRGGSLAIRETITPYSLESLQDHLNQHGFCPTKPTTYRQGYLLTSSPKNPVIQRDE